MALSADILRGYTDAIILRCLIQEDGYGYRIIKQVSLLSEGQVELKEPTLYTAFRRLESQGLIRSYWGDEQTGARRRYYQLTDEGRARLAQEQALWRQTRHTLDSLLLNTEEDEGHE
ncbi:MAG: helix-turn-helix transcriptional regulator [Clostridia bacterium]|nr:helix-turn-helix transcriptional regulator [Clostridia bacterium]